MLSDLRGYSLTSPTVAAIAWGLLGVAFVLIVLAVPRPKRLKSTAIALAVAVVLAVAVYLEFLLGFGTPAAQLSVGAITSAAFSIAGIGLAIRALSSRITRAWSLLPAAAMLLATALVANQFYALFPDVNSLDPETPYKEAHLADLPEAPSIPFAEWTPKVFQPVSAEGTVVIATPPTPRSGFEPRESYVYLPPAWFTNPRPQLPVLVLMPGIPGTTDQWFTEGQVGLVAHDYQRAHGGVAPIVITVDGTGGALDNPVCTDSRQGKIQTFLTEDIPGWLTERFSATPDRRHWTIGGLSYGGTCAFQTIVNHPEAYRNFLDMSGELTPNDGESHASTVKNYFGGSEAQFRAHNPQDLLKSKTYPGIRGIFAAGAEDTSAQKDLRALNAMARRAGIDSSYHSLPGGHTFRAWRSGIREFFPTVTEWSFDPDLSGHRR